MVITLQLTRREKKAQSRIRLLEQENEQLKRDMETRPAQVSVIDFF
jgi:hypothetical protein